MPKLKPAKREATAKHSLWTASQSMWKRSLDGVTVRTADLKPADERQLTEKLKPFETTVDPKSLIRFVFD